MHQRIVKILFVTTILQKTKMIGRQNEIFLNIFFQSELIFFDFFHYGIPKNPYGIYILKKDLKANRYFIWKSVHGSRKKLHKNSKNIYLKKGLKANVLYSIKVYYIILYDKNHS